MAPSASVTMMRARKRNIVHDVPGHDPLPYDHTCRVYNSWIRLPKKEDVGDLVVEGGTQVLKCAS